MNAAPHLHPSNLPSSTPASRKRVRENETPSQRQKREKAAERQRRKRERDRQAGLSTASAQPTIEQQTSISAAPSPDIGQDMSPEEAHRRDRVRAAARERQRKHRALVKQRKLRELGLDPMGNELMPGMEDAQYRVNPEGQYSVMPHELQHPPPPLPPHGMPEPPFPQGQIHGGQTFASTLLLSFSCAPLLKQHLLRTLSMTNEELASLEPIIAQAWDHWDQQRRMHFAAQHGPKPDGTDPNVPYPPPVEVYEQHHQDFRARFHRSLVAPTPFRTFQPDQAHHGVPGPPPAAPESGPPGEPIDPNLTTTTPATVTTTITDDNKSNGQNIDPSLSRARTEAAGVAGRLERS